MIEKIIAVVLCIIAFIAFFISYHSFQEKGFLFNNAYLYASETERKDLDKKVHYRQSAIVFLLLGCLFLCNAIGLFFEVTWMFYIVILIIIMVIMYAIVSSIKINKNKK